MKCFGCYETYFNDLHLQRKQPRGTQNSPPHRDYSLNRRPVDQQLLSVRGHEHKYYSQWGNTSTGWRGALLNNSSRCFLRRRFTGPAAGPTMMVGAILPAGSRSAHFPDLWWAVPRLLSHKRPFASFFLFGRETEVHQKRTVSPCWPRLACHSQHCLTIGRRCAESGNAGGQRCRFLQNPFVHEGCFKSLLKKAKP